MARPRKQTDTPQPAEKPSATTTEPEITRAAEAFSKLSAEMAALAEGDVKPVEVDIPQAVHAALVALPRLLSLRDAVAAQLPKHPIAMLDHLEQYALAAYFAHFAFTLGQGGSDTWKELKEEAKAVRKDLLLSAEPLAHKGLLDLEKLNAIREGRGDEDAARDLVDLAALYKESWPKIKNKTVVEQEDIDKASALGERLLALIAVRSSGVDKASVDELSDRRVRAFALFKRAYDQAARAAHYLRWSDGDAESYAPNVFKAPRARKPKAAGEESALPPPVDADEPPAI